MPAPHWLAPEPALAQTSVPPALTVQPCCFSSLTASVTLYGYGFWVAFAGVYGLGGMAGIGP